MKARHKQLTLHFTQDTEHILEAFKMFAKRNFRTPEQEIIFALSLALPKDGETTGCVVDLGEAFEKAPEAEVKEA